ncbi:hypothetical protein [Enterococcus sp. LJL90]
MNIKNLTAQHLFCNSTNGTWDRDRYDFEVRSPMATKEYIIVIDFLNQEITGTQLAYGSSYLLEIEDYLPFLEYLTQHQKQLRDFSQLLDRKGGY